LFAKKGGKGRRMPVVARVGNVAIHIILTWSETPKMGAIQVAAQGIVNHIERIGLVVLCIVLNRIGKNRCRS